MENLYLKNFNKKDCNGCGICALVCPKKCITMEEDEEGFVYPVIDEEKCIKCNRCKNICSNYNENKEIGKAYIAINKDDEVRRNSASGGMFFALASYVISKNGVVFGAKYDENLYVKHDEAQTLEECKKFRGSKYVRSDTTGIYEKAKKYLDDKREVLFTGTPCQCNALKVYLNKDYDNLILCEIICHANPSPKVFDRYKNELEKKHGKKVLKIDFRSKKNGWSNSTPIIEYEDGEKEEDPIFYKAFIAELINRLSCHDCKFAKINRQADFTIGDLWGFEKIAPDLNDEKGISLLIVNSKKAEAVFNKIKENMIIKNVDINEAFSFNHNAPVPPNPKRDKFFKEMNDEKKSIINLLKKYTNDSIIRRGLRKIKRLIKTIIKK